MDDIVERELKLGPPERFSLARLGPRLNGYVATPAHFERLHTVYHDTPDLRLTRWGCSLRFRRGEGWTLKIPVPTKSQALSRAEHVFAGDGARVPDAALDLATAYLRGATPEPVAELRTLRTSRRVLSDAGDDLAEIVEDDVHVVEGTRVVRRFRQVEIELAKTAPDDVLGDLADELRAAGAGKPTPIPKDVEALGARAREPEVAIPAIDARARIGDVARAALARSVERIVRYDATLRLQPDVAAIHDARVAVRRLRSDLRTFVRLFGKAWVRDLRERLSWLQDGLSTARDADVLIEGVRRRSEVLPDADRRRLDALLAPLGEQRDRAYDDVRTMLHDPRYVPLLQRLVGAAKSPPFNVRAEASARGAAPAIVGAAWKTLRKRVRRRTRPPSDRELHAIRIAAKRLRYAAETLVPVAGRRAAALARAVEQLQTILGEQHDAVTACAKLRSLPGDPERTFLAGELTALEIVADQKARAAWRRAWRKAKSRHRRFTKAS